MIQDDNILSTEDQTDTLLERKDFLIQNRERSIRDILEWKRAGRLNLLPDFQREYVWKKELSLKFFV
ncbi:MAG: hypothetical protein LBL60_01595 [Mycoplasmataceae bacterium]|nr:hypothetical protein [Mycoplasmataceae bacterium]